MNDEAIIVSVIFVIDIVTNLLRTFVDDPTIVIFDPLGAFVGDGLIEDDDAMIVSVLIVVAFIPGSLWSFVADPTVDDVMVVAVIVVIDVVPGPLGAFANGDPTVCDGFVVFLVDVAAMPLVVAVVNGTLGTFVVDPAIVKIDPSVTFVNDDFVAVAVLFMATGVVLAAVDPHAIVVAFGTSEILFSFKLKSSSKLLLPLI